MIKTYLKTLVLLFVATSSTLAQNIIPFDWKLTFDKNSNAEETIPINMLLSWQRQGISDLKPAGKLETAFFLPADPPTDYSLAITLLAKVDSVLVNGYYIGGGFETHFKWATNPSYGSKKFRVPHKYLKFGGKNSIEIKCSNYSYTGGKNHNVVKLYRNAQSDSKIKVLYKPDNHLFEDAQRAALDIVVTSAVGGYVDLKIQNDFHQTVVEKSLKVSKGTQSHTIALGTKKLSPGFYTVEAVLEDNGYVGTTSFFTIAPTKVRQDAKAPKGYFKFWHDAIEELKTVQPNFEIEKRQDLSTERRNGYVVKMNSIGGVAIYGYYFVPKKKGKFPAILHLPGYGYGFEHLDGFLNSTNEIVELALCVRGHGLSKASLATDFPTPGFFGYEICDINKIAYRQIYMDCLRAVDFLVSRQEVDTSKIGVMGSSQGGGLSLMTAGLAPKHISACAYGDPFPTDMRNHIRIRTLIEDELQSYLDYYGNKCSFEDGLNTIDFIDTKYFAKHIKANILYVTGLVDDDCPPRLGFSVFNEINSPKEFQVFPNDSHIGESNWEKEMMNFFKREFKF